MIPINSEIKNIKRIWASRPEAISIVKDDEGDLIIQEGDGFSPSDFIIIENFPGHGLSRFSAISGEAPAYVHRWWIMESWAADAALYLHVTREAPLSKDEWLSLAELLGGAPAVKSIKAVFGPFIPIHLAEALGWKRDASNVPAFQKNMAGSCVMEWSDKTGELALLNPVHP